MTTPQLIGLTILVLVFWRSWPRGNNAGQQSNKADPLSKVLFTWASTPFQLRHLMQSVLILGAAGSGKTSGSGRFFFKTLLGTPNSAGLIIASKPEERADVIAAFKRAGREKDLKILGPDEALRINFLDALGGDANNITNAIEVMAELMSRQKGESKEPFWAAQRKRSFYHTVVMLQLAEETINGSNIQKYLLGLPSTPAEVKTPEWQAGYCNTIMKRAYAAQKEKGNDRLRFDYESAFQFATVEWSTLADKTRSNIVAECMGVLHPLNSGTVRDLIGTTNNFKMEEFERGTWLLIDMPLQLHGESGRFVGGAVKYLLQRYILARHAIGDAGPICLWIDEAHNYITSYCAVTLAEQRSHRGCTVYLTQSLHALYANLGEHFTDGLCTNFGTKCIHLVGDSKTAEWASSLLGNFLDVFDGGSPGEPQGPFDTPIFKTSFNHQFTPVLQPEVFLGGGLRTSGGVVDAIVIRPDPFVATGQRFAKIPFKQE